MMSEHIQRVARGFREPRRALQHLAKQPFILVDKHCNYGTNVFERDWDLLVVLDACRYDLFAEFAPKHSISELLDSTEQTYSIASKTSDWLRRTLTDTDSSLLSRTHYITANGQAETVDTNALFGVEAVWRFAHDTTDGIVRPEAVTNEAIRHFRTSDADRYIVHYVQPHSPFLHCLGKYDSTGTTGGQTQNVWQGLRKGRYDKAEIWEDYGKNLLRVLDDAEMLIRNFEGKVVLTADHGNALGEFGLYGHPGREAAPSIRRVPWATATGLGLDEYEVKARDEVTPDDTSELSDLDRHLRDLGYRV